MSAYDAAISVVLGTVLVLLGWWGLRNAAAVVPAALPEHDRMRRERVIARGSITCRALGAVFIALGVLHAFL